MPGPVCCEQQVTGQHTQPLESSCLDSQHCHLPAVGSQGSYLPSLSSLVFLWPVGEGVATSQDGMIRKAPHPHQRSAQALGCLESPGNWETGGMRCLEGKICFRNSP